MVGRIDFILGVAGQYAISAAIKATFECDFLNVLNNVHVVLTL